MAEAFDAYRSFAPAGWEPPSKADETTQLLSLLADPAFWCVLAEEHRELLGHAAFLPASRALQPADDPALAHLRQLFVRRAHWGTGLAAELQRRAVEEAVRRGYRALRLFVPAAHARARRFYEREGWTLSAEGFTGGLGLPTCEYALPTHRPT